MLTYRTKDMMNFLNMQTGKEFSIDIVTNNYDLENNYASGSFEYFKFPVDVLNNFKCGDMFTYKNGEYIKTTETLDITKYNLGSKINELTEEYKNKNIELTEENLNVQQKEENAIGSEGDTFVVTEGGPRL
jgi:hypothetical protein